MTRFPRTLALGVIAVAAASTAGCSWTNQQQTQTYYMPADGTEALLGPDVVVSSVLVVAEDAESPGTLIARVVNDGTEPASVQITSTEADVDLDLDVPAGETLAVGPEGDEEVLLDPVGQVPGTSIPMTAVLGGGEVSQDMLVPILDGTLQEYADLVPTSSPTTS